MLLYPEDPDKSFVKRVVTEPGDTIPSHAVTVIGAQKQRVVTDQLEMPVVGAAFLLPMHRAFAGIHVEHDAVGSVAGLGLADQVAVHRHQPDEVAFMRQQLGLEPVQRGGERRAPVPPLWRTHQAERRVGGESYRVVQVFVARQAAVDRLAQEVRQPALRVQPLAGVTQVLGDDGVQTEACIQLTYQNQAGVGGDARPLKRDLQKTVEGELKWRGFFLTHRRPPILAGFLVRNP